MIAKIFCFFGRCFYRMGSRLSPNNGVRQSTLGYDLTTGRLRSMAVPADQSNNPNNRPVEQFTWNYLPGSDLKQSLTYPNGLTASWTYGNRGELLEVDNALPSGTVSKYAYSYDAAGRRIICAHSGSAFDTPDTYDYRYNARSELTNATASVDVACSYGYQFDDIGNRETASERGTNSVYEANNLNQYTSVNDFVLQFDDDGNAYVWDPTEPVATRPLVWRHGGEVLFYVHDGNKNVSEVVASDGTLAAHYEYASFGALTSQMGALASVNPFRFSCEYAEDEFG